MKMSPVANRNFNKLHASSNHASIHRNTWLVVVIVLGLALVWALNLRPQKKMATESQGQGNNPIVLSDSTHAILQGLKSSVEIKLYAPADATALPETLSGFAARVQQMLAEYDRVADGKIKWIHSDPQTDPAAKSAAGIAGVSPFTGTGGRICHMGIVITCGRRVEVMPQLAPEWEAALESDLSRAILRVSTPLALAATPFAQTMATPPPLDPLVSEELLKLFPDLHSQSFEAAAQTLREMALEEWKSVGLEMQTKVQVAQKHLADAREQKSESEQQSALKDFQRVQSEQADKLKQITARLQERITILERLKNAPHQSARAE